MNQVSHCSAHSIPSDHERFCSSFALYQTIILREISYGRIEIALPHRVLRSTPVLSDDVKDTLRLLYKNITAYHDVCINARLMHIATSPLTALYLCQKAEIEFKEQMIIHLVGKLNLKTKFVYFHLTMNFSRC